MFYERDGASIHTVIEDLEGSCNSIDYDDFTESELEIIDSAIFECESCGWWTSQNDSCNHDGMTICSGCYDEYEEEEYYV